MSYKYKKVIVLGNNGSGKSYFSKRLAEKTKLPLIHLDLLYWLENWEHPCREQWIDIQKNVMKGDSWILDGMYISTFEMRFMEAEVVYFLDIDKNICLESVKQREEEKRTDFPTYLSKNQEQFDILINGLIEFEEKRKPRIIEMHNKYPNKDFIVFKTRDEMNDYLNSF